MQGKLPIWLPVATGLKLMVCQLPNSCPNKTMVEQQQGMKRGKQFSARQDGDETTSSTSTCCSTVLGSQLSALKHSVPSSHYPSLSENVYPGDGWPLPEQNHFNSVDVRLGQHPIRTNGKELCGLKKGYALIAAVCFFLIVPKSFSQPDFGGFFQGYSGEWNHVSQQLIALAEATPTDKFLLAPGARRAFHQ